MDNGEDYSQLLSQLSPEELDQLMGLGGLNEQGDLLEQQMAQANALRNRPQGEHYSLLGGLLSGVPNAIGAFQQHQLNGQLQNNIGQRQVGRRSFLDLLRGPQQQPQQPQNPMGYGPQDYGDFQ